MKILITGADGFIGSHLVEKLLKKKHEVRAFCFYNSINSWGWLNHLKTKRIKNFDVVMGDIRDFEIVKAALKKVDVVYNLASLISIPYSYVTPRSYIQTNIIGALNVLEASKEIKVKKIIQISTSEVYGTAKYVPIDEKHPVVGQSPYSASKIAADQLSLSFNKSFGLPVSIIRPFNTFGPRQSFRAVIPTIIRQLINGNGELHLGFIKSKRDFSFIDDTTEALCKALTTKKDIGDVTNLGSGYGISIEQIAKLIGKKMNKKIKFITDERKLRPKASEVYNLLSSNVNAKKKFNWKPKFHGINGLSKALDITINWYLKNFKDTTSEEFHIDL
jgi:NAD dependent epimerase/dehydratase